MNSDEQCQVTSKKQSRKHVLLLGEAKHLLIKDQQFWYRAFNEQATRTEMLKI